MQSASQAFSLFTSQEQCGHTKETAFLKKSFARNLDELKNILLFVDRFVAQNRIGEQTSENIMLILDELFTNQLRHATGGKDHIDISLDITRGAVHLELVDFDVNPFDLTGLKPVNIHLPLEERRPEGIGIHLVLHLTEDLKYEHEAGTLRITAVIGLEGTNV